MSASWPMVPLGDVFGSVNRPEPADDILSKENRTDEIMGEIESLLGSTK